MAGRKLGAEERALWARVIASVTPLDPKAKAILASEVAALPSAPSKKPAAGAPAAPAPPKTQRPPIGETLDASWDRRLSRGTAMPDMAIDLHGHTLDSAYRLLDSSLDRAIRGGARIILLITGKPPRADAHGGRPTRGAIRAAVGDWLAASRHAGHIAAVRGAHPRHGGTGALYIILKRSRPPA